MGDLVDRFEPGEIFDSLMRQLLMEAMARTRGNQAEASRWLGLSRSRLIYRMQRYGIDSRQFQDGSERCVEEEHE